MLTDNFFRKLPEDPVAAVKAACDAYYQECAEASGGNHGPDGIEYSDHLEFFGQLIALVEESDLNPEIPEITGNEQENINQIGHFVGFVDSISTLPLSQRTIENARTRTRAQLGIGHYYEFTEGDLALIQTRINELREMIRASEFLPDQHKERMLRRLERLQSEMHKRMSTLDRIYGGLIDFSMMLQKFGENVKPLADMYVEIAQATWRTHARAEELESGAELPMLMSPSPCTSDEAKED